MSILQTIKRAFICGPVFEVRKNVGGDWFVHEIASNGQIVSVGQAYSSKSNAVRAAKKRAASTLKSTWRIA